MTSSIELREDNHVIYYKLTDPWTASELKALYAQEQIYRDQFPFNIHTFMDIAEARSIPPRMLTTRQAAPSLYHPRSGHIVVTGATQAIRMIAEASFRVARFNRVKFFEQSNEAWAYLRQIIDQEGDTSLR